MSSENHSRQRLSGWGRFPRVEAQCVSPRSVAQARASLENAGGGVIPRGMGRSYGDSALGERVIQSRFLDHLHSFDETSGILSCGAGVPLSEIIRIFLPKGWFLAVTPGTQFVSVGGAIASDVHGKNHHLAGTFGESVVDMDILLSNGQVISCSRDHHVDLFRATCGGMGLTGIILRASIRLQRIPGDMIEQTTLKSSCLEETLDYFETTLDQPYSVGWIDCLASGRHLGRSLLMTGHHEARETAASWHGMPAFTVPVDFPSFTLNRWSVGIFNKIYYGLGRHLQRQLVPLHSFFYPLDRIGQWNRLYGKAGFLQYQAVIPKLAGRAGLTALLDRIAASGEGSFLAVLKLLGKANDNFLSFPMEGYTLALDFRISDRTFRLLEELDAVVLDHGGRLYLTKDARMPGRMLEAGYSGLAGFRSVREKYGAAGVFESLQSRRLGI